MGGIMYYVGGVTPENVAVHKIAPETKRMQQIEKLAIGFCSKLSKVSPKCV